MTILIIAFRNFANAPKNGIRQIVITITVIKLRHQNCPPTRYCTFFRLLCVYRRWVLFSRTYLASNKGCTQLRFPQSSPPSAFRAQ